MKGQLQFPEEPEEEKLSRFPINKQLQKNEIFCVRGFDGTEIVIMDVLGGSIISIYEQDAEIPLAEINTFKK